MTDHEYLRNLRIPTIENPLRIMFSACFTGVECGFDGTTNGTYPTAIKLQNFPNVKVISFCPEAFSFGTPRDLCDIHNGNGDDVLDGRARVISTAGEDWTSGMIQGAQAMLRLALNEKVELAVLMDISAACGSQVIYLGNRVNENKVYQIGSGVAAALLKRNGIKVISQRDFASLEILYSKLDSGHVIDTTQKDHHQTEWYLNYFGSK